MCVCVCHIYTHTSMLSTNELNCNICLQNYSKWNSWHKIKRWLDCCRRGAGPSLASAKGASGTTVSQRYRRVGQVGDVRLDQRCIELSRWLDQNKIQEWAHSRVSSLFFCSNIYLIDFLINSWCLTTLFWSFGTSFNFYAISVLKINHTLKCKEFFFFFF